MSIKEMLEKGKLSERKLFIALLVILVALLAFGLGRLSKIENSQQPIQIENALEKS